MSDPTPAVAAPPSTPNAFTHSKQPDWGVGLVLQNLADHWVLFFEKGGEKKLLKRVANDFLTEAKLDKDALAVLHARASGRKLKAAPKPSASHLPRSKKPAAPAGPRFSSFKVQLDVFLALFPGGFNDEKFIAEERGRLEGEDVEGYKEAGIALAKKTLSAEAFATGTPEALFDAARAVLKATNIVFPIEGAIPFGKLKDDERTKAVAAVKDLLHGAGEYGERLARFAGALQLKDGKDTPKKTTWPLATVFGALFDPTKNTAVKPTAFSSQAQILGLQVDKSHPVNAEGYAKFLDVAQRTQARLVEGGQTPRDLMDVYSFIWTTHAQK